MAEATSTSPEEPKRSTEELYWLDTYTWAMQQADALRRRDFSRVDWDNVIEEIEAVGKSELRSWKSHCANLIRHMLKLEYWRSWGIETGQSWIRTITRAREQMLDTLDESPGLQSKRQEMLEQAWKTGRRNVASDLAGLQTGTQVGRDYKNAWREWERKLPSHCPYELAAIEDPAWWPEAVQHKLERDFHETGRARAERLKPTGFPRQIEFDTADAQQRASSANAVPKQTLSGRQYPRTWPWCRLGPTVWSRRRIRSAWRSGCLSSLFSVPPHFASCTRPRSVVPHSQ